MNSKTTWPFTVKLYVSEPDTLQAGSRVFDVLLQGETVLPGLDSVAQAGGARHS